MNLTGGQQFTLTVTLNSQASTVGSPTVSAITTDTTGFGVDSVSPSLPYTLGPGASVAFTITLTAPSTGYDGTYTVVVTTS